MTSLIRWSLMLLVAVALLAPAAHAEKKEAQGPKVGHPAPEFALTDAAGKEHKLSDFRGKILVVHFQSIQCPWEHKYQPMLNEVANKFTKETEGKVVFLGINANKAESYEDIAEYTMKKQPIPYTVLKDPGNKIADAYAAQTTPHMYVIDENGVLRYMGGIEKAPSSPKAATQSKEQYLVPVLTALVNGSEPPVTETRAIGCSIKREKK